LTKDWSKSVFSIFLITIGLVVVAIITSIPMFILIAIFPVLYISLLYIMESEGSVDIELILPNNAITGDEIEFILEVKSDKGFGFFTFNVPLPPTFDIVDSTNVHILHKGIKKSHSIYKFRVKPLRRGKYNIDVVEYTYYPTLGIIHSDFGSIKKNNVILVRPRLHVLKMRRIKILKTRINPKNAKSRLGPVSTEFEKIREYTPNDSYKKINWKATARVGNTDKLLVNEYEREGENTIIFIMDRGYHMRKGSLEENPLEYSINYVYSYSKILLSQSFNVGFWFMENDYNVPETYIMPSSGMENFRKIKNLLISIENSVSYSNNYQISNLLKRIVMETGAVVVILTSLYNPYLESIKTFAVNMAKIAHHVLIVDVISSRIVSKNAAPLISSVLSKDYLVFARNEIYSYFPSYIKIVPWDPVSESLATVIYKTAIKVSR